MGTATNVNALRRTSEWPGNVVELDNYRASLATIKAKIVEGGLITFADQEVIRAGFETFANHAHSYNDYQSVAEFGNSGATVGPTFRATGYPVQRAPSVEFLYYRKAANYSVFSQYGEFRKGGLITRLTIQQFFDDFQVLDEHRHSMPNDTYFIP